ncbi:heat shock protein [Saccharomycopsis crataegensis]|uniref:Heat shock protein n=1 Tax=Saccharomycopsis crataegensis TaxID=43959 RepID=A0AAV5QPV1_9ASCO|nr:heat shock protein [Saccharomycopsis crataegensis]
MSFYPQYDIYDLMEAVNQRRMLQQQQQQQQQQQRRRAQMVQPQRRQQEQPVYFAQARPSAGRRGYGQRQSSYASPFAGYSPWYVPEYEDEDGEDDDSKVYTLEDILNLVNRHRHRSLQSERLDASELAQKRRQAEQELAAKKQAQECAEEAAAVAQLKEQQEEAEKKLKAAQDEEDSVMTDAEGPQPQVFDIADFIRQALLAGSEEEEEEEASRPASPVTPTETVTSEAQEAESVPAKKPEITKKPSSASVKKTPTKVSSFHMPAPSPIHDPLQVSHPEMDRGLPFSPNVDVYDKPSQYKVVLALPGASKDSFEIDFHPTNHELVIRGSTDTKNKMVSSSNDGEVDYLKVSEIRFGAFERSIKFPILPKINDEAIGAKYSNGLLEVCVPKVAEKEAAKPKKRVTVEEVEDEELKFEEGMKKL